MNAHSPLWNPHCQRGKNANPLEELIENFDLLINNESGRPTRPASGGVSIIDLALSTVELGPLTLWEIPEDYPSLSDHELIVLRWDDMSHDLLDINNGIPTGWDIQSLINVPEDLEGAHEDWISRSNSRRLLDITSNRKDLDRKLID